MNAYQQITEKIISKLESGEIPWHKPWAAVLNQAVRHSDGSPYSVFNQMLLDCVPGEYITFAQAKAEGGHIKKGAKSTTIYLWKHYAKKAKDEKETEKKATKEADIVTETLRDPEKKDEGYWFLKTYQVFNINDAEDVKRKWDEPAPKTAATEDRTAEVFVSDYMDCQPDLSLKTGSDALYSEEDDTVIIPDIVRFHSKEQYYKTLFHQLAHSTGADGRLSRKADAVAYRRDCTSREDLLAEICSAMVCSFAGLDVTKTVEDTAAYIDKWIPALRKDPQMIVWASQKAEQAARYIMNDMPEDAA